MEWAPRKMGSGGRGRTRGIHPKGVGHDKGVGYTGRVRSRTVRGGVCERIFANVRESLFAYPPRHREDIRERLQISLVYGFLSGIYYTFSTRKIMKVLQHALTTT